MKVDNGETFYSLNGKFPFMDLFDDRVSREEESNLDSQKDQCRLPYPKNWRPSPVSPLEKNKLSPEDHQNPGAVRKVLVNPQRPAPLEEKVYVLCKKNGESRDFYTSHLLKDSRGKVICPPQACLPRLWCH